MVQRRKETQTAAYDRAQRSALEDQLRRSETLRCPVCDTDVSATPVPPPPGVAYVRRRVWVLCPRCRRTASLDIAPRDG